MNKLLLVLLFLPSLCFADFKVVERKSDGEYVYRAIPEFKEGYGIKNAIILKGGKESDYREITITQSQWDNQPKFIKGRKEKLVKDEEAKILRATAISNLKKEGKLEEGYK